MPLEEDKWAKGKCGFKALQYMSLGIPPVVSPVGVNTDIVQHGENGMICHNLSEWKVNLSKLLANFSERQALGKQARITIEQRYSVKANIPVFLSLFDLAMPALNGNE